MSISLLHQLPMHDCCGLIPCDVSHPATQSWYKGHQVMFCCSNPYAGRANSHLHWWCAVWETASHLNTLQAQQSLKCQKNYELYAPSPYTALEHPYMWLYLQSSHQLRAILCLPSLTDHVLLHTSRDAGKGVTSSYLSLDLWPLTTLPLHSTREGWSVHAML